MPTVVGIDTSLTSTGIVMLGDGVVRTESIRSSGKKDDSLWERKCRLRKLAAEIVSFCHQVDADLVVIEGPSMASKFGHPHDRAGLWWLVVAQLQVPIMEVPPSIRMKYATGKGMAQKDDVLTSVLRRYPEIEFRGNDQADALVLAAIGRRVMQAPIEEFLPQSHLDALNKVRLP